MGHYFNYYYHYYDSSWTKNMSSILEKILLSTGGKLRFNKCYWHLIRWGFDAKGIQTMTEKEALPASLYLTNWFSSTLQKITWKFPSEALETLGVFISSSGSMIAKLKITTTYLDEIILKIKITSLSMLEASLLILVYLHSKLHYILTTTTFSKNECESFD